MRTKLIALLLLLAAPLAAQKADTVTTTSRDSVPVSWTYTNTVTRTITVSSPVIPPVPVDTVKPPVVVAGCTATDLVCDDFEDGSWYSKNCDQATSSGGLAQEDGWCGSITGAKIYPTGAFCGNVGYRSNCAASRGQSKAMGDATMASISLRVASYVTYTRFYLYYDAGYQFGAEKILTYNNPKAEHGGGIDFGNLHNECGQSGGPKATGKLQWQPVDGSLCRNIMDLVPERWYYIEVRLDTRTGALDVWGNECGTTACTGTPTKRLTVTGLRFPKGYLTQGSLWFENWSNPGSSGTSRLDRIRSTTTGPIGF